LCFCSTRPEAFTVVCVCTLCHIKSVDKIQVLLKSDKNSGCFTRRPRLFFIISCSIHLRMRNVSRKSCRENQNTHFVSNNYFRNRAVCEMLWKNIIEPGGPQITKWRVCTACWIPKATHTKQWLQESASALRYTYIACLAKLSIHNP
jgi:hypothetical protein